MDSEEKLRRFQKALDLDGSENIVDVCAKVKAGEYQFWEEGDGTVITRISVSPRKKRLVVVCAFGVLKDVLGLVPRMSAFGKEHGCADFVMSGRLGWDRVLPRHGWRKTGVTYALDIGDAQ